MGKFKENPRYNVISFRAGDQEYSEIRALVGDGRWSEFMREAAMEKVQRERQRRMDDALSARSL